MIPLARLLACALVALFLCPQAQACESPQDTRSQIEGRFVSFFMAGTQAQRFIDLYNEQPPATDYIADSVLLILPRDTRLALICFYTSGCLTKRSIEGRWLAGHLWRLSTTLGRKL